MAYEDTEVAVAKSQDGIRKLIYAHKGTGLSLISHPPREGFEALVEIEKTSYRLRIMATCKQKTRYGSSLTANQKQQEERRVWRVLYWHLKAMFEAADSGVIDIRDVVMPYVVMHDGRTLSEHIVPRMPELMTMDASHLLTAGQS